MSKGSKKELRKITPSLRLVFPGSILILYLVLWHIAPEKTILALRSSMGVFFHALLPLCMVFLLMIGLNIFLKPPHLAKLLGKETSIKEKLVSAIAGIISAGPIYAWYPILKELREKGAKHSLIAIFLVNRAVKPFLVPMMISFFGWAYVVILTLLTVAGSLCVGFIVGALLDSPTGSHTAK
ncbi:MAG: permease [Deltaproteobacteria bacterium]|nr:permease [Deltaproteobacteria bacterium]